MREGLVKVLDLSVALEAEDDEGGAALEAFRGEESVAGMSPATFRYPVLRVKMRVGVSGPVAGGEP